MESKIITGVFVDEDIIKDTMVNTLEGMYEKLDCDLIDIFSVNINGVDCDVILDDEGKFKEEQNVAMVFKHNGKMVDCVVGKIFLCKGMNETGELASLSDGEIETIIAAAKVMGPGERKILEVNVD